RKRDPNHFDIAELKLRCLVTRSATLQLGEADPGKPEQYMFHLMENALSCSIECCVSRGYWDRDQTALGGGPRSETGFEGVTRGNWPGRTPSPSVPKTLVVSHSIFAVPRKPARREPIIATLRSAGPTPSSCA